MEQDKKRSAFIILAWGGLWGIFEATVGYLLHLLPISIGSFVWYPVACFVMYCVFRQTGKISAIFLVGLVSAAVKLLNLLLPVRVDKVINPAVSIVLEAIAMTVMVWADSRYLSGKPKRWPVKLGLVAAMNTGWRLLYAGYLLFLVPDWIREVSVLASGKSLFLFFLVHNLSTTLLIFIGWQFIGQIDRLNEKLRRHAHSLFSLVPVKSATAVKAGVCLLLLGANIALQMVL